MKGLLEYLNFDGPLKFKFIFMKKILLAILVLFFSNELLAQVKFEENDLKAAITKAKTEGKMVMIIGSATW